jgi:GTP-binding protein
VSTTQIVSIVGRPNVGKSSLFNRILKKKVAVIDDMPGVTRDRNYMAAQWNGVEFSLVDTGGVQPTARESMITEVHRQVDTAVEESAVVIFMVEAIVGPTDIDEVFARQLLRSSSGKVICVVNKAESQHSRYDLSSYLSLGFGQPHPISALHGYGVADLLDRVTDTLTHCARQPESENESDSRIVKIAILGRPNAGKSSLVNKLLNQQRMIVDPVPGTTRDAIDSLCVFNGTKVVLIDTAGLRKKAQVHDSVEYYSNLRAINSIRRSDICALMVDCTEGFSEQDLRILRKIFELKKGAILCLNKWDIVKKDHRTFDRLASEIHTRYMEAKYIPIISLSALTGQRVGSILHQSIEIYDRLQKKVAPGELRDHFFSWVKKFPHPIVSNKSVRMLGIKQVGAPSPLFRVFTTNPHKTQPSYTRYLLNKIHETWDFTGCPVSIEFRRAAKPRRQRLSAAQ